MDRHERTYRALLAAYPSEHRLEYGEPMAQLFVDRFRDEAGGPRSVVFWVRMLEDLARSAFTERLETTVRAFRSNWWLVLSVPLSIFTAIAGVGLPFEPEDTAGPNWLAGAVAYAAVTVVGLGLVVGGVYVRRRKRKLGSTMIAVGVMPAFPMTIMFWFPPVASVGVLSIVVSIAAFVDAPRSPQSSIETVR